MHTRNASKINVNKKNHVSIGGIKISQPKVNLLLLPSDGCLKGKNVPQFVHSIFEIALQFLSNGIFTKYSFNFLL